MFALSQLAYLSWNTKRYILFNLLIMLIFFIGSTIFLIRYAKDIKSAKTKFSRNENQNNQVEKDKQKNGETVESQTNDNLQ